MMLFTVVRLGSKSNQATPLYAIKELVFTPPKEFDPMCSGWSYKFRTKNGHTDNEDEALSYTKEVALGIISKMDDNIRSTTVSSPLPSKGSIIKRFFS